MEKNKLPGDEATASAGASGAARLLVFARPPVLGRVKTRLAATLGPEVALVIYRRLLVITQQAVAAAAVRSCAWAGAGAVRTSMARTIRPVARHWRKACAHVGRSGRGHGRGGVMDAHCAAGRRDGCFQRSGPASRQPSQRDAGLNISTRSVMTPSVPRSIRRCAAHSSLTV